MDLFDIDLEIKYPTYKTISKKEIKECVECGKRERERNKAMSPEEMEIESRKQIYLEAARRNEYLKKYEERYRR